MQFDRVAILDWSAAGKPKTGKDSIWLCVTDENGAHADNIPTRLEAESALSQLIEDSLNTGKRLLLGVDFALSAPKGFTDRLTGTSNPFAFWSYLRARIIEGPNNYTNYREVAAEMNASFDGDGPFWGNTTKQNIQGLPRTKPPLPKGIETYRRTEVVARHEGAMPKTLWQLAGAGAVGAQSLTGIAMLARLKAVHPKIKVWPFEIPDQITLAEVYPSLIASEVRAATTKDCVPDQVQVTLLSKALYTISNCNKLGPLLSNAPEDGAILGSGQGKILQAAMPQAPKPAPVPSSKKVSLSDLSTAFASLGFAPHRIEKTPVSKLIGHVLAQDLKLGALRIAAKSRVRPNALPAIVESGILHAQTYAPVRVCLVGDDNALAQHMLTKHHATVSPPATLPKTASRIKARLTALAIEHDFLVCADTSDQPSLLDLLSDATATEMSFSNNQLSPFKIIQWRNTPILIVPEQSYTDPLFLGLVIAPFTRIIGGENYAPISEQRRVSRALRTGLTYGTLCDGHFQPIVQMPPEAALANATHVAELVKDTDTALTYALSDLGLG